MDIYISDTGPKLLEDMTKEELIEAVRTLGRMLRECDKDFMDYVELDKRHRQ